MIISAFLVHCDPSLSATDALQQFGNARTHNGKGVTIPSQMRYVHYYHQCLQVGAMPAPKTYRVRHFRLHTIPNLDPLGGCDPYFDARVAILNDEADPTRGLQMRKVRNRTPVTGRPPPLAPPGLSPRPPVHHPAPPSTHPAALQLLRRERQEGRQLQAQAQVR